MTITLGRGDIEEVERKAVRAEMWYDRHRREWVIYPVDEEGNQLEAARYGFSKREAQEIKDEIEADIERGAER